MINFSSPGSGPDPGLESSSSSGLDEQKQRKYFSLFSFQRVIFLGFKVHSYTAAKQK